MNGRLYDPVVGRFFSPDNYVQLPDNPQSYNRYSYCLNNPLKYTDPSGQFILPMLFNAALAAMIDVTVQNVFTGKINFTQVGISALTAGLSSGVNSLLNIHGFVRGALSGAAQNIAYNGLGNLCRSGKWENFFNGWLSSGITGGISGGLQAGGKTYEHKNMNYWWGNDVAKNRTRWSFWNWDLSDFDAGVNIIYDYKVNIGTISADVLTSPVDGEGMCFFGVADNINMDHYGSNLSVDEYLECGRGVVLDGEVAKLSDGICKSTNGDEIFISNNFDKVKEITEFTPKIIMDAYNKNCEIIFIYNTNADGDITHALRGAGFKYCKDGSFGFYGIELRRANIFRPHGLIKIDYDTFNKYIKKGGYIICP